ncbi:DUF3105 domain-containing protein [Nocardiopsis sp. LOL_012]|uniref:DUF3105 domain-containing protein n=1 Tax=Nocardiopsis sp. LOL_012 TaxID=3345409 RepID=UPI003A85EC63
MAKKKTAEERRRKAAELREERRRLEKRRKVRNTSLTVGAVVLVVGLLAFLIVMAIRDRNIAGLEEYEVGSYQHVADGERVDYEQLPPVGGNHWNRWQNCGVYPAPVTPEFAVHSLEHGAVWINYDPELDQEQVDLLTGMYNPGDYLVISPYEGEMDAPIVASSWGRQVAVETADDDDLRKFVTVYERGSDVPEPGAACSGGVSQTAEEVDAALETGGSLGGQAMDDGSGAAEEPEGSADAEASDEPSEEAGGEE